tara:strand:- start:1474 stop:1665 length:192 start_codon:yes stop_codon:yes gene_type:complete
MGGILSYGVESEENTCCDNYKVDKCTQTCNEEYCTKCKELKSKIENLENKVLNIEKGKRTILL